MSEITRKLATVRKIVALTLVLFTQGCFAADPIDNEYGVFGRVGVSITGMYMGCYAGLIHFAPSPLNATDATYVPLNTPAAIPLLENVHYRCLSVMAMSPAYTKLTPQAKDVTQRAAQIYHNRYINYALDQK